MYKKNLGRLTFILPAVMTALLFVGGAEACDYCLITQGISPLDTVRGSGIRVNRRITSLKSVYKGTSKKSNPGAREEFTTTEITGFHGYSENLLFMGILPYRQAKLDGHLHVHEDGDMEVHPDTADNTGVGDITLLARYSFLKRHTIDTTTVVAGVAGIKLSTGKTDVKASDGADLDAHLQLGTGSTDYLLGISSSHSSGRTSVSANLLFSLTGNGKAGPDTHRFGNTINYDVTGKYGIRTGSDEPSETPVFIALGLNGEIMGKETLNGAEVPDSGGHKMFLSPGFQVSFLRHWTFEVQYFLPVYRDLNGTQIAEDYKLNGGITYLF